MHIIIALMLLLPAAARAAGPGAYYFIAVQNGAYNFKGGAEQLEESYKALRGMVKLADAQNARLTLLFSAQYAIHIASDPARLAELEAWKKAGHEIGAYHQGPAGGDWDGYSDLPEEALARVRKEDRKDAAVPGSREYFEALGRLAPGIKSGCMPDGTDKKFMEAAPPYEICGAPADKGINKFLAASGGSEKPKKSLSCFHPSDKAGIAAAKEAFSSLSSGVYGASFKSSPSEFGAFYSWLAFLKGRDPQGLRSRTVSAIVDGRLLTEKEIKSAPAVKKPEKQSVQPRPEAPRQEIPRLKPVPSLSDRGGRAMPGLRPSGGNTKKGGYCGDGLCDAIERANPGRCPRDCGR